MPYSTVGFTSKLLTGSWAPCFVWAIIPQDSTIDALRFCDHNRDLEIDMADGLGLQIYTRSVLTNFNELASRLGSEINTTDLEGTSLIISTDGLAADTVMGGKLDGAIVKIGIVDRNDPEHCIIRFLGYVGNVELTDGYWTIQVTSLLKKLDMEPFRVIAPECHLEFGSVGPKKCNVPGILASAPVWQASTTYSSSVRAARPTYSRALESLVAPTVSNGFFYYVTNTPVTGGGTGVSGATEPTWPTTVGATVVDGQITWTAQQASFQAGAVTAIANDFNRIFDINVTAENKYFSHGKIAFTSGRNEGKEYGILSYTIGVGNPKVELIHPPYLPVVVGDTFNIMAGCSKAFNDDENGCRRWRNQRNFGGFPYVPGVKLRGQRGLKDAED